MKSSLKNQAATGRSTLRAVFDVANDDSGLAAKLPPAASKFGAEDRSSPKRYVRYTYESDTCK